jgi:hypothetical protein
MEKGEARKEAQVGGILGSVYALAKEAAVYALTEGPTTFRRRHVGAEEAEG